MATCIVQNVMAQGWHVLQNELIYNFSNNEDRYLTHQLWVDSVDNQPEGDMLYLNRIAGVCDTCENLQEYYPGQYYTDNYPQFLMKKALQTENYFWMQDSMDMIIFPKAGLNETWLFYSDSNITAEVVSAGEQEIFGQIDSVKVIDVDGREIVLSKSFGLLEFPDFATNDGSYVLIGIEGGEQEYGYQRPELHDFYDIEIGQGIKYEYSYSDVENADLYHEELTLYDKTIYEDSIVFYFDRFVQYRDPTFTPPWEWDYEYSNSITKTVYFYPDHPAISELNQLSPAYRYDYWDHCIYPISSYDGRLYSIVQTDYKDSLGIIYGHGKINFTLTDENSYYNVKLYDSVHNIYYDETSIEVHYMSNLFRKNIGIVNYCDHDFEIFEDYTLINWTDENGEWVFSSSESMTTNTTVSVFPNPVSDILHIQGIKKGANWRILDLQGRVIKSGRYAGHIYLNTLKKGMYILQVAHKNNTKSMKFVKH